MAATTDREQARERLGRVFQSALDRLIPPDPAVPLAGGTFVDWEDRGDELARALVPAFLEERAALDPGARADVGGRCPHCGSSDRVYLAAADGRSEVATPYGPVVLDKQRCRCRACDRAFSPAGPGLGDAGDGRPVAQGGGPGRP